VDKSVNSLRSAKFYLSCNGVSLFNTTLIEAASFGLGHHCLV